MVTRLGNPKILEAPTSRAQYTNPDRNGVAVPESEELRKTQAAMQEKLAMFGGGHPGSVQISVTDAHREMNAARLTGAVRRPQIEERSRDRGGGRSA